MGQEEKYQRVGSKQEWGCTVMLLLYQYMTMLELFLYCWWLGSVPVQHSSSTAIFSHTNVAVNWCPCHPSLPLALCGNCCCPSGSPPFVQPAYLEHLSLHHLLQTGLAPNLPPSSNSQSTIYPFVPCHHVTSTPQSHLPSLMTSMQRVLQPVHCCTPITPYPQRVASTTTN